MDFPNWFSSKFSIFVILLLTQKGLWNNNYLFYIINFERYTADVCYSVQIYQAFYMTEI